MCTPIHPPIYTPCLAQVLYNHHAQSKQMYASLLPPKMSLFSSTTITCEVVSMEISPETVAPIPKEESDDRLVHALRSTKPIIFSILKLMASTSLPADWTAFHLACFRHEFLYQMVSNLLARENEFVKLGATNKTFLQPLERTHLQTWIDSSRVQRTRILEFKKNFVDVPV